ncbi:MAG: PH domain-containing protein [Actinomycetota bacterium]|nr:PH domain-containing protein [Actinomycetota bacterium]
MDQALYPTDVAWRPVSPRLVVVRRAGALPLLLLLGTGLCVAVAQAGAAWLAVPAVGVAILLLIGWAWWAIGRACRSWGYAERENDLLVRHGLLVRRLSVVPYGRMQFIDVTAGPVDRRLGIATVHLHTAAAASDARIPGLPAGEAARLRDRLAALGEARAAGL